MFRRRRKRNGRQRRECCLVASLLASDVNKMDDLGKQISKELYDEFKRVADEGI